MYNKDEKPDERQIIHNVGGDLLGAKVCASQVEHTPNGWMLNGFRLRKGKYEYNFRFYPIEEPVTDRPFIVGLMVGIAITIVLAVLFL